MKIYFHAKSIFILFIIFHLFMSQEFDIHRELWDYCDEKSRRISPITTTLPTPTPTPSPTKDIDIEQFIEIIEEEEEKEREMKRKKQEEDEQKIPSLDTPENIFHYMVDITKNSCTE
jgi:hypothetical protein